MMKIGMIAARVAFVAAAGLFALVSGCDKTSDTERTGARQSGNQGGGAYEATGLLTLDGRRSSVEETFNTRLAEWQSDAVIRKAAQAFCKANPAAELGEEEVLAALREVDLSLQPDSRIVIVRVRADIPELAAGLANAYADAIVDYTDEQNKMRCDRIVKSIHERVAEQQRKVAECAKQRFEARDKDAAVFEEAYQQESRILNSLLLDESKARIDVEMNNEHVSVGRRAVASVVGGADQTQGEGK